MNYAPRTRARVIVFAAVVGVSLVVVFALVQWSQHAAATKLASDSEQAAGHAVAVEVVRVVRSAPERVLTLPGEARAFAQTTLFARVSGYLKKWNVDIGDKVKKGQVLATIETPELDDQLQAADARLAQLNADANVAKTAAQFAKVSFERWEAAAKDGEGAVSGQERDAKHAEMDSSIAKLEAAKASVNLGAAQLQGYQTLSGFKEVRAPYDGVITRRDVDVGDLVTAGSTSNTTPLFTVAQSDQIRVWVDVPQPAVPDIQIGMQAQAITRERPGLVHAGIVDRTREAMDARSRTLGVEVLIPNPDLSLLPGMYVEVTFQTSRKDPPLRVPAGALAFGPNGPHVAVVASDGRITFHPITIARDLGDAVEIGSGLADGDVVALNIGNQVVDGERVDPHEREISPKPETASHVAAAVGGRADQAGVAH